MRERDLSVLEFPELLTHLSGFARSAAGKEACLHLRPEREQAGARAALEQTAQLFALLREHGDLPLGAFPDLTAVFQRAARPGSILEAESLLAIREVLDCADAVLGFLRPRLAAAPALQSCLRRMDAQRELRSSLHRALDASGQVADEASEELAAIRREIRHLRARLQRRLEALLTDARMQEYLADRFVTVRHNRYVLPIRSAAAARFEGIVQDRSSSGETAFMEPLFAVEMNNRLALAAQEEERIVRRILFDLTEMVRDLLPSLQSTFEALVELDCAAARARLAASYEGTVPEWSAEGVEIRQARHPLLLARGVEAVPIDLLIPPGKQALVLTGPNTGGKTVALKTLGLLALMAQSGMLLPAAAGARLPFFRAVFADIGDEQSLARNLSTFSAHIANLVEIVHAQAAPALVLLDEPGVGTDPEEGAALAIGLVRELLAPATWLALTTHYLPIKTFALAHEACVTAAVDFDLEALRPRYRLVYHSVGESLGLPIARRLGLPEPVLRKAAEARSASSRALLDAIATLEASRREYEEKAAAAEAARAQALRLQQELEALREQLARQLAELRRAKRERVAEELREAREFLHELKQQGRELLAALERGQRGRSDLLAFLREKAAQIEGQHRASADEQPELAGEAEREGTPLQIGDWVEIPGENIRGRLVAVEGERAWIQRGSLRFELPARRLRRAAGAEHNQRDDRPMVSASPGREASEISLLGLRAQEALEQLERFLDRAVRAGEGRVRIIHGVGSGALKRAVGDYLARCPYRVRFRGADPQEGGAGVTIVELEN